MSFRLQLGKLKSCKIDKKKEWGKGKDVLTLFYQRSEFEWIMSLTFVTYDEILIPTFFFIQQSCHFSDTKYGVLILLSQEHDKTVVHTYGHHLPYL